MKKMGWRKWILYTFAFLVAIWGGIYYRQDFQSGTIAVLEWIDGQGAWAPFIFICLVVLSVPLVLPGFIFTLGAGFLFGLVKGVACIVVGISIGAVISFLLARYAIREQVLGYLNRHPRMDKIEEEVSRGGWKLVMFTRMIPMFPFKLSNYAFGCTRVKLKDFWLGNTLGIFPLTITNVYMGSVAGSLASIGSGVGPSSPLEWGLYGAGMVVTVIAFLYLVRYAKRAIQSYQEESNT